MALKRIDCDEKLLSFAETACLMLLWSLGGWLGLVSSDPKAWLWWCV